MGEEEEDAARMAVYVSVAAASVVVPPSEHRRRAKRRARWEVTARIFQNRKREESVECLLARASFLFLGGGSASLRARLRPGPMGATTTPMPSQRAVRVVALAFLARLASAALATAAVSAFSSLDGAGPLTLTSGPPPPPSLASNLITALTAWDGAFFGRASVRGVSEHDTASCAFAPWAGGVSGRGAALLAGKVLPVSPLTAPAAALAASWAAFLGAAVALDAVGEAYLPGEGNKGSRTRGTLLFIFSPASAFATGLYAESWHALGLTSGLVLASRGRPWASACALALATASRSTGVLGAVLWALATPPAPCSTTATATTRRAADRCARAALAGAPALLWQAHAWLTFCVRGDGSGAPPWCAARTRLLGGPFVLSIPTPPIFGVQARDWGVGFGRYFRLTNLPHYLLATPALAIALGGLVGGGLADPPGGVGVPGQFSIFRFFLPPFFQPRR